MIFLKSLFPCCLFFYVTAFAQSDTAFAKYDQHLPGTNLSFTMLPVSGGGFEMGSSSSEKNAQPDEQPAHKFLVSSFWMSEKEITYDEYDAFFRDEKYSRNQPEPDAITRPSPPYIDLTLGMGKEGGFPANSMSQYGALMYCRWLFEKTGIFYRLPTEAEWEYTCRAGTTTPYFFGKDSTGLSDYAWYAANSSNKYHKTGLKKPNPWGFYDMLGNVAEWTMDQYEENYFTDAALPEKDPMVPKTSRHPRTLKGGNYADDAIALRSAARLKSSLDWNRRDPQIPRSRWWNADAPFIGFRLVRPLQPPSKEVIEKFFKEYLDNY